MIADALKSKKKKTYKLHVETISFVNKIPNQPPKEIYIYIYIYV